MAPKSHSAPFLGLLGLFLAVNLNAAFTEARASTGSPAVEFPALSSEKNWTGPEKAYNIEHNQHAETGQDEEDAEAEKQNDPRPYVYGMEARKDADQEEEEEGESSTAPKSQEKTGKSAGFTWLQPPRTTNQYYWTPPETDNEVALGASSETDVAPRMLQACGASTANGVWSSTTPPAPSCPSVGCFGCCSTSSGASRTSITAILTCNPGYTLTAGGTGDCHATRRAYCSWYQSCGWYRWRRRCSWNQRYSCDGSWSVSASGSFGSSVCSQCVPPSAPNAITPSWSATRTFTWRCNSGAYGQPVSRTCDGRSGWTGSPISCSMCIAPAAANAITPSVTLGQATYTWTCQPGFVGTPVSRTCDSTTGLWSGVAISCFACNAPAAPTDGWVRQLSATVWEYGCNPGTFTPTPNVNLPMQRTCTAGGFTGSGFTCQSCGAGYYCPGNGQRYQCQAGQWASPSATRLTTAACSGACSPGYYCPLGATSPTQIACGAENRFCPAGSAWYQTVADIQEHTTPLTAPINVREGKLPCKRDGDDSRRCEYGRLFPAVIIDDCASGTFSTKIAAGDQDLNTIFHYGTFQTPQMQSGGTISNTYPTIASTVTFLNVKPTGAGCTWGTGNSNLFVATANNGVITLRTNPTTALKGDGCPTGYTFTMRVARTSFPSMFAECNMNVVLTEKNVAPYFQAGTCSAPRSVMERSPIGTVVGSRVVALDANKGQQMLYSIDETNVPFAIEVCSGVITVSQTGIDYGTQQFYDFTVRVKDTGAPQLETTCGVRIQVLDINDAPTATITTLSVRENTPIGTTAVGSIGPKDPDGSGSSLVTTVIRADAPDHFRFDSAGNIFVKVNALDFETKSRYVYKVEISDGVNKPQFDIVIDLINVNDAPVITGAQRTIKENSAADVQLSPANAISCTDQDGDAVTISLPSDSAFKIVKIGSSNIVAVKTPSLVDFEAGATQQVRMTCDDGRGGATSAVLDVTILDEPEPPVWNRASGVVVNFPESTLAGAILEKATAGVTVSDNKAAFDATDPDRGTVLAYRIVSALPAANLDYFKIDGLTGIVSLAKVMDFETVSSATTELTFSVSDGTSTLTMKATFVCANVDENPYFTGTLAGSVNENSQAGVVVGSMTCVDPEGGARTFALVDTSAEFEISGSNIVVKSGAKLDRETTPSYRVAVSCSDPAGNKATGTFVVTINDVQEPPVLPAASYRVQELSPANTRIGAPVAAKDPDVGQKLTFSLASANTWATIDSKTGQMTLLKATGAFDTMSWFMVNDVKVCDDGTPQYCDQMSYNISVVEAPIRNNPPVITLSTLTLSETTPLGAVLDLSRSASDPDNHAMTYSIQGGDDTLPFGIALGSLTLTKALDFERDFAGFAFTIVVTDQPTPVNETELLPMTGSAVLRVVITDVNEVCSFPTDTLAFKLDENVPVNTQVGTLLRANDPDSTNAKQKEGITYSITSGNTGSVFQITTNTDGTSTTTPTARLSVARASINFEVINSYDLDITARDLGGLSCTMKVRITVNNLNDPPKISSVATISVPETTTVGSNIGSPLTASDEDGNTIGWTIDPASNVGGTFLISAGGQLSLAKKLDFETRARYDLVIRADDGNGGTDSVTVVIQVQDQPEPPVYTGLTVFNIFEAQPRGALLFTATAIDEDRGDVLSYALTAGNVKDTLAINRGSGVVTVALPNEFDYEVRTRFDLELTVTDSSSLSIKVPITINILNVNEAPLIETDFVEIWENSATGTSSLLPIITSDPDGPSDNNTITITGGNARAGINGPLFSLRNNFIVVENAVLNFEVAANKLYSLTITAVDSGMTPPAKTTTKVVQVRVLDLNEVPVFPAGQVRFVDENSLVGTLVGAPLVATDQDVDQVLSFTLIDGPGDMFAVDGCTGTIKVNQPVLNFEGNNTFTLTLKVTDDGPDKPGPAKLSATQTVTVQIKDVNEVCSISDVTRTVQENSPVGTPLGAPLVATDPDTLATNANWRKLNYALDINPRNLFKIDPVTGQLSVAKNGFDFEDPDGTVVTAVVKVTDGGGLSCSAKITCETTDINEPPVVFAGTRSIREATYKPDNPLKENTLIGAAIEAVDPDAGQTPLLSYSIANVWPSSASGFFGIVESGPSGGKLFLADFGAANYRMDYETYRSIIVLVNATDPYGLSGVGNLTVALIDQNENPSMNVESRQVFENATVGASVGIPIPATDPEKSALTFTILGGNSDNIFDIDILSGQVKIKDRTKLNYEVTKSYTLSLQVEDNGQPGDGAKLSAASSVVIDVLDSNDPPTILPQTFEIDENSIRGTTVAAQVVADDEDVGDKGRLTYTIVSQDAGNAFVINAAGFMQVATVGANGSPVLNFEQKKALFATVRVTDPQGATAQAVMTINLKDVPEDPFFKTPTYFFSVAKNAKFGTVIGTVQASDEDAGDTLTYSLHRNPFNASDPESVKEYATDPLFDVNPDGSVFVGKKDTTTFLPLDTPLIFRAKATDSTGRIGVCFFNVTVVESNDPPVPDPPKVREVRENMPSGTMVGVPAGCTDNDAKQTIRYAIVSGNIDDMFAINPQTAQITVQTAAIDFEQRKSYTLTLSCTDNGPGALSATYSVTIGVLDMNEDPWIAPTSSFTIDENSDVGTMVGSIDAKDVDAADAGKLRFSLPASNSFFQIIPATGALVVSSPGLNFESLPTHRFTVRVTDVAGSFKDGSVVVSLVNKNDQPILPDMTFSVPENAYGAVAGKMAAQDEDIGQTFKYELTRPNDFCWPYAVSQPSMVDQLFTLPLSLPNVLNATSGVDKQTVSFRARASTSSSATSLSIRISLRATSVATSDRYELTVDSDGKGGLRRCSGAVCGTLFGGSTFNMPALSPRTFSTYWVSADRKTGEVSFGSYASGDRGAISYTAMTATDPLGGVDVRWVGVSANAVGTRISSICFAHPTASAGGYFTIDELTGQVTTSNSLQLDYEQQQVYGMEFKVTDQPAVGSDLTPFYLTEYGVAMISISDVNERPTWQLTSCVDGNYLACLTILENSLKGDRVGQLPLAVDPDTLAKQTLSYKLLLDNNLAGSSPIFSVDAASALVSVAQSGILNFEDRSSYVLTGVATDSGSPALAVNGQILVTVKDVCEPPTLGDVAFKIEENSAVGTLVGDPIVGKDPDFPTAPGGWGILNYTIVRATGSEMTAFGINATSGQLFVAQNVLDFETKDFYQVRIRAMDGCGFFADAWARINILDRNERPVIVDTGIRIISEASTFPSPAGRAIYAEDPDRDTKFSWSVVGGTGMNVFTIGACSGVIEIAARTVQLNYEKVQNYTLQVMVEDSGVPKLSDTKWFTVLIEDANDTPTLQDGTTGAVFENVPVGTAVNISLVVDDEDFFARNAPWIDHSYSIVSGNDRGLFRIDSKTGKMFVAASAPGDFNFEDARSKSWSLLIRVQDAGVPPLKAETSVTINAVDVNEPPFFLDAVKTRAIDENTPRTPRSAGDAVGAKVQAGDVDTDHLSFLTFSVDGGSPAQATQYFDVVPSGANAGQIRVTAAGASALDFESLKTYTLHIRVTDPGRVRMSDPVEPLSVTTTYTIQINDINEAPACDGATLSVFENSALKTLVGTPLNSTDPEKDVLSWFISDGNDGGTFSIDSTGQILVADPRLLDFETRKSFKLTVTVKDAGAPEGAAAALSSTCTVDVAILDVNEPPVITPSTFVVLENSVKGSAVGDVAPFASDVDAGDVLTYAIVSQDVNENGDRPFIIDRVTGAMAVNATASNGSPLLNFEGKQTYAVAIRVTDKGGLSATASFTVNLRNYNEQVEFKGVPDRMFAAALVKQNVGQALINYVRDPDAADTFSFAFEVPSDNVDNIFKIDSRDGRISVVNPNSPFFIYDNVKGGAEFPLRIRVTDSFDTDLSKDGPSTSAVVTVIVQVAENNKPPTFALESYTFSIPEGSVSGLLVATMEASDENANKQNYLLGQQLTYTLDAAGISVFSGFFPFNITTQRASGIDKVGAGLIWIRPGVNGFTIDYEVKDPYFEGTVVAQDDSKNPLSTTVKVRINITDVPEAPYFNAATRTPNTGFFTFTVDENSIAGTQLVLDPKKSVSSASDGIKAIDEDRYEDGRKQNDMLQYYWKAGQPDADLFTLDATTGIITVSAAGDKKLNFEGRKSYTLVAVAEDPTARRDEATVTIVVNDINEAPSFTRQVDSTGATITFQSVNENAAQGFIFGRVLASDPDAGAAGALTYSLADDEESKLFLISPLDGSLSVKHADVLDWEAQDTYSPTVIISDNGSPKLSVTRMITIKILDVADLRITKINLAPDEEPLMGVNIVMPTDGSAPTGLAASHGTMSALVITAGGTKVRLSGTNMGPKPARLSALGITASQVIVRATYGLSGTDYTATGCKVITPYEEIECTTVPGVGVDQVWRVTISYPASVAGAVVAVSQSSEKTGYIPPSILNVVKANSVSQALATSSFAADGTTPEAVVVTGTGFGPAGTSIRLYWKSASAGSMSPTYISTKCTHLIPHEQIQCNTVPGVGKDLSFRIEIAGSSRQTSSWYKSPSVRYREPSIANVLADSLETVGGQIITLIGSDFGPEGTAGIELRYSPGLNNSDGYTFSKDFPIYVSSKCDVDPANPHTVVKCAAAAGVGNNHYAVITVAQQSSPASKQTIRYLTPRITDISGLGTNLAITEGGQQIIISGTQLGPLITQEMMDTAGWSKEAISYLLPLVKYGYMPSNINSGSFEAVNSLQYTAMSCSVTVAHRQIICLTSEGVGKDLFLGLVLGGQTMGLYTNKTINYHPPILAYYSGPGAANADTRGSEQVIIEGKNFGPLGTVVQRTTYGMTGEELTATNCSVVLPHTRIICQTAVGAGAGLSWKVTIADQRSVAPTTSYAPPEILSFEGPGAVDASTDGGDVIILKGRYFSVQKYLNRVTFGPSGNEYSAIGCKITMEHTEITCTMPPGTGRMMRWIVSVGGQSSRPSEMATSYQAPKIFSITPFAGPTAGRVVFAVFGTGFALKLSPSLRQVRMNAIGLPSPTDAEMNDYWTKALAGLNPIDGVSRWISSLTLLREDVGSAKSDNGNHTIYVALPEGFGVNRRFLVTVDGIPSNTFLFSYDPPFIRNAAPDRLNVPAGKLRVFLEGSSFCNGFLGCGRVLVQQTPGGAFIETPTLNYTHSQVVFVVEDPADGATRKAVIEVDGVRSNEIPFKKPVPNFLSGGQEPWLQMNTKGGDEFRIYDIRDIGSVPPAEIKITIGARLCTDLQRLPDKDTCAQQGIDPILNPAAAELCRTYKLIAKTPAGVGRQLPIIVIVPGGQSREDKDFTFSYAPPVVTAIKDANDPSIIYSYDDSTITDPVGSDAFNSKIAMKPGVDTVGAVVIIEGKNFGTPELYRNRTVEQPDRLLEIVDVTLVGSLLEHDDERIKLRLPPGIGVNLLTKLAIAGQTTFDPVADKPNGAPRPQSRVAFRYKTPTLTAISPSTNVATTGGDILTITGMNFGPLPSVGMRITSQVGPAWNMTGTRAALSRLLQAGSGSPAPGSAGSALFGNFGLSQGIGYKGGRNLPYITINGEPCKIPLDYPGKNDHTQLVCYAPEAEGQNLIVRVVVGDQISPINTNVLFTYAAPVVYSLTPLAGPTSGRDDDDRRIVMELVGENLGRNTSGVVRFDQPISTSSSSTGSTNSNDPSTSGAVVTALGDFQIKLSDVLFHNHTVMRFYMPEGAGENLLVRAVIGGQDSLAPPAVQGVYFSYLPPEIKAFRRYDRSEYECLPRRDPNPPKLPDGRTVNRTLPAGCYRTMGGYPLMITGKSFGPPQVRSSLLVTIGGEKANVEGHSHNMIIVNVPRGMGDANPIVVTIGGRSSAVTNATLFAYDPPVITNIAPNTPDALEGETVNIRGYNFGFKESPFELLIGGLPCVTSDWLGDELMTCELGPTMVGNQNISLLIANRTDPVIFYESEEKLTSMCRRGSYGMSGEWCIDCETDVKSQGAVCPGKELYIDKVYSKPGFWRSNVTTPNSDCHELRQGREKCPLFLACSPLTSCLGKNKCDEGYEGERCAFCLKGKYYRVDGECVKCPNNVWMIIIGFILMGVGAAAGAWYLNKKNISLALFGIFLNYAQVLSIFGKLKIKWPPELKQLFKFLSAFAFNLDLAAPECLMPELNQVLKWVAFESIPMIAFCIFGLIYVTKWCYKYFCLSRKSKQLNTHLPQLISMGIIVMRVLYLQETKQALDVFNCQPTDPPDGKTYQSGNLDAPCYTAGSIQNTLWPMAAIAVTVYTIGFPTFALWWLRKNKYTVQLDQLLKAQYTGDDRKTNPYFTFRKTWKQLYQNMTVRNWFWEPLLMFVKGLLVFSSLMFRASPQYQMAVNIAILTVFIVFHMRRQPYLSSAQRKATLEDHQRKVFTSATHAKMEAELQELYKRNKMGDKSKMGMTLDRLLRHRNTLQDRVVLAAFDYNTVETVLTAILILVNLGGVMLSSDRFVGARFAYNKDEYDAISGLIIFLIISGLLFWMIAFIFDLMIVLCPNSAKALMGGFSKKSKALAAAMNTSSRALGKSGASTRRLSIGPGAASALAISVGDASGGETSGMSHNPFLAARMSIAGKSGGAGRAAAVVTEDLNGAVKSIMSLQLPPDQEQWAAVKKVFETMSESMGTLQTTVKELRQDHLKSGKGTFENDTTPALRTATIRSEFTPTLNSTSSSEQAASDPLGGVARGKVGMRSAAASKQFGQQRAALAGYGASSRRMLAFRGAAGQSIRAMKIEEISDSKATPGAYTNPLSSGGSGASEEAWKEAGESGEDSVSFANPLSGTFSPSSDGESSTNNARASFRAASTKRTFGAARGSIAQRTKPMGSLDGEGSFDTISPLAEHPEDEGKE